MKEKKSRAEYFKKYYHNPKNHDRLKKYQANNARLNYWRNKFLDLKIKLIDNGKNLPEIEEPYMKIWKSEEKLKELCNKIKTEMANYG